MTYFEDQEEAWFDGGREWYMTQSGIKEGTEEAEGLGIMGDFDPYLFWGERVEECESRGHGKIRNGVCQNCREIIKKQ